MNNNVNPKNIINNNEKYTQVIYEGSTVQIQEKQQPSLTSLEITHKNTPLIVKEIDYKNAFSKFCIINAIFGIYYFILLILRITLLLTYRNYKEIIFSIIGFMFWAIGFRYTLQGFHQINKQKIQIYKYLLFGLFIIESQIQTKLLFITSQVLLFLTICFIIFYILSIFSIIILTYQCNKTRILLEDLQTLKQEQLQISTESNVNI